ncbi:three-helix bundle dimerization domain-containing protein [Actinospica robiniae]|uniref:three-helix bundle dimerization domain-containing protein n=1 Tax=Actinospica robiniae TaxID=304901 RepID=UPI00042535BA|nr:hypothetical protein [Actinospica robiniae]
MPANMPARPDSPTAPSPELEHDAIGLVKQRLRRRYPDVAPERVGAAVDGAYHRFDHSRVRTFVPILVEHEAREELAGPA